MMSNDNSTAEERTAPYLRAVGFCGADDSVNPKMLGLIAQAYPFVEFGILFKPGCEGQPRFASTEWVELLAKVVQRHNQNKKSTTPKEPMKLAAHLCGTRVNDLLHADDPTKYTVFLDRLHEWGFRRIQINATAVNGVDTSRLDDPIVHRHLCQLMEQYKEKFEFIFQKNEETKPLWEGVLLLLLSSSSSSNLPDHISMLEDESKGTGVKSSSPWPSPPPEYKTIGYAGGIGPHNIQHVLKDVLEAAATTTGTKTTVWIDMESKIRSVKNDQDVFDLDKCYQVIDAVCQAGLYQHPEYLA